MKAAPTSASSRSCSATSALSTTQIYTRVSIRHLKEVHDSTHPGAKLERRARTGIARQLELDLGLGDRSPEQQLRDALDAEAGEELDPDDEP